MPIRASSSVLKTVDVTTQRRTPSPMSACQDQDRRDRAGDLALSCMELQQHGPVATNSCDNEIERFLCTFLENVDYDAMTDFFLTYRSYIGAFPLLRLLCERYTTAGLNLVEAQKLRVRIFVALRHWILNYYSDDFLLMPSIQIYMATFLNGLGGVGADEISTEARISKELKRSWFRESRTHERKKSSERSLHANNMLHRSAFRDRLSALPQVDDIGDQLSDKYEDSAEPYLSAQCALNKKNLKRGDHRHRSILSTLDNPQILSNAWTGESNLAGKLRRMTPLDDSSSLQTSSTTTRSSMENIEQALDSLEETHYLPYMYPSLSNHKTMPLLTRTLRRKPARDLKDDSTSCEARQSSRSSASTFISEAPYKQYGADSGFETRWNDTAEDQSYTRNDGRCPHDGDSDVLDLLREMHYGEIEDATEAADSKSGALQETRTKLEANGSGRKRKSSFDGNSIDSNELCSRSRSQGTITGSEKRRKHIGVTRLPERFVLPKTLQFSMNDDLAERESFPTISELQDIPKPLSSKVSVQTSSKSHSRNDQYGDESGSDSESSISIVEALAISSNRQRQPRQVYPFVNLLSPSWILSCNTACLAQALTIIEKSVFSEFDWREVTSDSWVESINKVLPLRNWAAIVSQEIMGLGLITARFNCFVSWTSTKLMQIDSIEERVGVLIKFIDIASLCKNYGNYASMMQIITSLTGSVIQGLTKTWKRLPADSWRTWNSLRCLGDDHANWHLLKVIQERALLDPAATVIPFLGCYLSDLLEVEQSTLSTIPRMRSIAKTTKVLLGMLDRITLDEEMDQDLIDKLVWVQGLDDTTLLALCKSRES